MTPGIHLTTNSGPGRLPGESETMTPGRQEYSRRYYAEHREERQEYQRRYSAEHREEVAARHEKYRAAHLEQYRKYRRTAYAKCPKTMRAWHLKKQYNLTLEDYDLMLTGQAGACAVCGNLDKNTLHVDHDHITGKMRWLLCSGCNRGLGGFRDDPDLLRRAAAMLEDWGKARG